MISCERVPLLAPNGSTITLTSSANAVPTGGTAQLIATVIEAAGTPPHSGTHVIFTTTLGSVFPTEMETDINGRAIAVFRAGDANGMASITASSGAASVGAANALKIAVGSAAVGDMTLGASPTTLPATGGSSTISATVIDISGNRLPGVPVGFTVDFGSVSPSNSTSDGNGVATTILTTSRTSKVTATAGIGITGGTGTTGSTAKTKDITVQVNVGPSVTLSAPTPATPAVGQPVTLTVTITAPGTTGSPIRSASISWGDGLTTTLGTSATAQPVQHTYGRTGTYTIIATVTDVNGDVGTAISAVTVISATPSVGIVPSNDNPTAGTSITFTITATIPGSPTGVAIQNIFVDFGDGKSANLGTATSTPHTYTSAGTFTATATVTTTAGTSAQGSTTVTVK